jgi:hypothetical protein
MGAIEVLDHHPPDALGGPVDGGVKIDADLFDHGGRRIEQVDLHSAELVGPATRPVLVPDTDQDPFDAVAVACQHEAKPTPHVLGQRIRHRKSLRMNVNHQFAPRVSSLVKMPRI